MPILKPHSGVAMIIESEENLDWLRRAGRMRVLTATCAREVRRSWPQHA
jgi:hypothetical protein